MAFQVYFPKEKKPKKEPQPIVSLSKSSIVLNKLARAKIQADKLELAYDPEKRIIRIRPGTDGSALTLKKTKVHARGFFKHFDINKKGKFEARYDEKENALYVQI